MDLRPPRRRTPPQLARSTRSPTCPHLGALSRPRAIHKMNPPLPTLLLQHHRLQPRHLLRPLRLLHRPLIYICNPRNVPRHMHFRLRHIPLIHIPRRMLLLNRLHQRIPVKPHPVVVRIKILRRHRVKFPQIIRSRRRKHRLHCTHHLHIFGPSRSPTCPRKNKPPACRRKNHCHYRHRRSCPSRHSSHRSPLARLHLGFELQILPLSLILSSGRSTSTSA